MIELRLTAEAAVTMFEAWMREIELTPGVRLIESGNVKLDTVPSGPGANHLMDGSLVRIYYHAAGRPSAQQIREAAVAVQAGIPRHCYSGRLIDIKRGQDGSVYFKVRTVERRSEDTGQAAFRAFNPSKGQLLDMVINPREVTDAAV